MTEFYKFANKYFKIDHHYPQFNKFAKDYEVESRGDCFEITSTIEDAENWKNTHPNEEGIDFPLAYLETLVVQSKIADVLARLNTFVFHGSSIYLDNTDNGFIFTAKSGTGKSTHSNLLKEMFGSRINYVNDDKPFLSFENNNYYIYGSPWNGKEHRSNNIKAKLKAIFIVERANKCEAFQIAPKDAIVQLIKQIHIPSGTLEILNGTEFLVNLCKNIPIYILRVDMSSDAPKTSYGVMSKLSEVK